MTRKFNKILAVLAVCVAAACPATTCSFDATLPPMVISYGYLFGVPPIWIIDVGDIENLDDADATDSGTAETDG